MYNIHQLHSKSLNTLFIHSSPFINRIQTIVSHHFSGVFCLMTAASILQSKIDLFLRYIE